MKWDALAEVFEQQKLGLEQDPINEAVRPDLLCGRLVRVFLLLAFFLPI